MKKIPIVIVAFNRPPGFDRLLYSLERAQYPGNVDLFISIDGGGDKRIRQIAELFSWKYGRKEIIEYKTNIGLREHIINCGNISMNYDGIVILEDDLYVSPVFYYFVQQCYNFYEDDAKIAGFSLYAHDFNETAQLPFFKISDDSDTYFFQYASSWGQFYTKKQWSDFLKWYSANKDQKRKPDNVIPININNWLDSSWKKYFIDFLVETNQFFVYPKISHTTNFGVPGFHMKDDDKFLQIPLQYEKKEYKFRKLKESNLVYDTFCEILPDRLKRLAPMLENYDFAVDLFGMKDLKNIKEQFILTTKECSSAVFTFGKELKPLESNVFEKIPGTAISFSLTEHCIDSKFNARLDHNYTLPELLYAYNLRKVFFTHYYQIQKPPSIVDKISYSLKYYFNKLFKSRV